jgi:hypothetical protein
MDEDCSVKKSLQMLLAGLAALSFAAATPARAQDDEIDITPIEYGDSLDGEIVDPDMPAYFAFDGSEGDEVTIIVESRDIDPEVVLVVVREEVEVLEEGRRGAIEAFELPEDNVYVIAVLADDTGEFTVTLEEGSGGGNNNGGNSGTEDPAEGTVFEESFDRNNVDWEEAEISDDENGEILSVIDDGVYLIDYAPIVPGGWVVAPGFNDFSEAPIFEDGYIVRLEVDNVNARGDYYIGLMLEVQEGYEGWISFILYPDGSWSVFDNPSLADQGELLASGSIDEVDFERAGHTLGAVVVEGQIVFLVDDEVVEGSLVESVYNGGTIGMTVGVLGEGDTVSAEFDNFVVISAE